MVDVRIKDAFWPENDIEVGQSSVDTDDAMKVNMSTMFSHIRYFSPRRFPSLMVCMKACN